MCQVNTGAQGGPQSPDRKPPRLSWGLSGKSRLTSKRKFPEGSRDEEPAERWPPGNRGPTGPGMGGTSQRDSAESGRRTFRQHRGQCACWVGGCPSYNHGIFTRPQDASSHCRRWAEGHVCTPGLNPQPGKSATLKPRVNENQLGNSEQHAALGTSSQAGPSLLPQTAPNLDQHVADVHVASLRRGVQGRALVLMLHFEVGVDPVNCKQTGGANHSSGTTPAPRWAGPGWGGPGGRQAGCDQRPWHHA